MPSVYLVGYDGSEASRSATRLTAELAGATGADVIAITAYPPIPLALAPGAPALADAELEASLRRQAEERLDTLDVPGVDVRRALPGPAARALVESAEREGAALIAVGVTHRGALGRMAPGSVAERLLHGAGCPVLVVPADAPDRPIHTIAVAYDDGREARVALEEARALATRLDAELVLLAVAEPRLIQGAWVVPESYVFLEPRVREQLERRFARAAEEAGASLRIMDGAAGRSLVEAAGHDVDLLVCGSRGYGPVRSVLAGSVSRHLVDHAPCPVMVVPRGARPASPTEAPAAVSEAPS
jgi:nucleotide-binding universal stress UspA family protein